MGEELRRLFDLLENQTGAGSPPGECNPPTDVIETPNQVEVIIDASGAHAQVEAVIDQLTDVALAALDRARIDKAAREVLRGLASAVTHRVV